MAVTETGNTGQVEGSTFGTGTVTCSLNTGAGKGVILVVSFFNNAGAVTITIAENQSNPAPALLVSKVGAAETVAIYFWKNLTTGATGHQFSATPSGNSLISLSAIEVTGQHTTTQAGATNSASGAAATTTPSAGAITPANGSLAVCGVTHDTANAPTLTAGTGWTRRGNIPGNSGACLGSETRAGAGASVSGDWTLGTSSTNWAAVIAEIQAAPSGTNYTQSLSGTLSLAGARSGQDQKPLAGALTLAGSRTQQSSKLLSGAVPLAATLAKAAAKPLAGAFVLSGAFSVARVILRSFTGALALAGSLASSRVILRSFVGSLALSGSTVTRSMSKFLAGAISLAGALTRLGGSAATLAPNLLAAIIARAQATPALMAALPGGIWTGKVPDEMPNSDTPMLYPAAALNAPTDMWDQWNTSGALVRERALQVSFFVAGGDPEADAEALVEIWSDTFNPKMAQLVYARGYVIRCATTGVSLMPLDDNAPDGSRLHQMVLDFQCQIGRNPAA